MEHMAAAARDAAGPVVAEVLGENGQMIRVFWNAGTGSGASRRA